MDRRDFLKTLAVTGAVMTVQRSEAMDILAQKLTNAGGGKVDLVAVMGGEPEAMFRRAITEMGGMKQFIKPGQKVVVKPNIGWDKVPELAGNTNPKLVAEIVKQCLAAGAKEVTVLIILVMTGRSATRTAALKKLPKLRVPRLCRLIWKATTNQSHCPKAYA